ncbi:MAG: transcription termination factor NusA [Defluviitaleaceae bacterium]|nr:transcription termination factor NusA [Defluviitaleaceae bacterium]
MMDNGRELIDALAQVSFEKGIDKEIIFEAIEASLVAACKKQLNANADIRVVIDREEGGYTVLAAKTVVEEVADPWLEMSLKDAREINSKYEPGDLVETDVTPKNFGRIAAQNAKQVVVQKFREAEREILYNEYIDKENEVITAIVQRRDRRNVVVSLGRLDALILPGEQIPREPYQFGDRIKVYVTEVKQNNKGPVVNVSRTCPELLEKLFEQEVPEVSDGIVEIKAVAREAGNRSKVAVYTRHPHVDPIGSCVGQNGQRVNVISSELRGEKLDIILWNEDPVKYIAHALSPSKVVTVATNQAGQEARVIVPDHQLSLAIGKEGQNARLAARLTGWRIDIKSESQARGTDFLIFPEPEKLPPTPDEEVAAAEMEAAYADFYEAPLEESAEGAAEPVAEGEEYYDDEYYDDEYYDDEYYDDEYYDDEYYDDEYYDDEVTEPAAEDEATT